MNRIPNARFPARLDHKSYESLPLLSASFLRGVSCLEIVHHETRQTRCYATLSTIISLILASPNHPCQILSFCRKEGRKYNLHRVYIECLDSVTQKIVVHFESGIDERNPATPRSTVPVIRDVG